jgi:pyruvate dehydrogenase E2 component (dihydrolipoamide acetyltransferase)
MSFSVQLLERLAPWPKSDFSEFGAVEVLPLSRYQKLTGAFLGRNWVAIPHVTHHDVLDITAAEEWRKAWNRDHQDAKVTPVVLLIKAVTAALAEFPQFNASLTEDGNSIVLKKYFSIGIAVETPNGLLVPVIRGCNQKDVAGLATELTSIAERARSKGLTMAEMSGSSMAISSLGHIGGTGFTPIINAPDVAILGVTRSQDVPVRGPDGEIAWRTMLPVSLSYDHRVINGADAARFTRFIAKYVAQPAAFDEVQANRHRGQ